ncbi:MAG: hypothetical protein C0171_03580 [Caldisphaera sp.]|uniref:hypothetical protein n=1 Tax=Caldisphaera sp. TaxID=2060322 RepID=UPI000CC199B6|nr:MAG: hypothetical protein C0202_01520 [Caldisphaera sp.]PMP91154.1 MAG: hypothetical protein C0171_03580 [Caldisphaera sp.]
MKNKRKILLITTNVKSFPEPDILLEDDYSFYYLEIKDLYRMSKEQLINKIINYINKYDIIILPGNLIWDFSEFNGKIVKGTIFQNYLFDLIKYVKPEELSPKVSADKIYGKIFRLIVEDKIKNITEKPLLKIKNLEIYKSYPRVFAEIFLYNEEKIDNVINIAKKYIEDGADSIILGIMPSISYDYLKNIISSLNKITSVPIGLDGNIEILKNFKDEVDILMSFSIKSLYENIDWLYDKVSVLLINETNEEIKNNIRELKNRELKIILDPIAYPPLIPGFLDSLIRAKAISDLGYPIMMGVNNVSELIDADTTGVNALSTFLSIEAGASIILTGEASVKNRGSVFEVKKAIEMAKESITLKKPPKDGSINLLALKEKDWLNNKIKIYGDRDLINIIFDEKTIQISCIDDCPISKLNSLEKKDLMKLSILIFRFCSPWSMEWDC